MDSHKNIWNYVQEELTTKQKQILKIEKQNRRLENQILNSYCTCRWSKEKNIPDPNCPYVKNYDKACNFNEDSVKNNIQRNLGKIELLESQFKELEIKHWLDSQ